MKKNVLLLSLLAAAFSSSVQSETTDLVIIGAGGAGMSAAIEAHHQGAKVILLEKMPFAGGNTARAEAGLNAAGTELQKSRGIEDSPEIFYEDTMKGGRNLNNPDVVRTLTEHAKDAVVFLKENGADLADLTRTGGSRVDRTHRPAGGAPAGSVIVVALIKKVKALGIDLRTNTSVTAIMQNDKGDVAGVKAKGKKGEEFTINAKKVMITSGGFGANADMVRQYDPKLAGFKTTNAPGAQGEGIKMAQKLNAKLVDMQYIQIHPSTVPGRGILITEAVRGDGAIMVNESGKRFVNELLTRDVVSQSILKQPGVHAYLIFNDDLVKQNQATQSYFKQKLVAEGDTLEELANAINVDGKQLAQTVSAYSHYAKAARDDEFGRESMKLALDGGKYYAIEITPGIHHTMGGIAINNKAQVVDVNGKVIPNLFAAGEAAGGVHGANRLGGNSLADIVTYGRIGAAEAVKEIRAGQ